MTLKEYIDKYYGGNQSEFGRAVGVPRALVNRWIKNGFIVHNNELFSPRRALPPVNLDG